MDVIGLDLMLIYVVPGYSLIRDLIDFFSGPPPEVDRFHKGEKIEENMKIGVWHGGRENLVASTDRRQSVFFININFSRQRLIHVVPKHRTYYFCPQICVIFTLVINLDCCSLTEKQQSYHLQSWWCCKYSHQS